ncbi:uncharacterized protein LOC126579113 [Anopheles aquasalis]|uniref:uncharacterized protein LOC126579113 n=1 Tax=Anopheles aquasalis TaxID=42839 RepID=UPI00215B2D0E|nr:uncharacterized protein LOC126579113 [Anopheles aquasalis]
MVQGNVLEDELRRRNRASSRYVSMVLQLTVQVNKVEVTNPTRLANCTASVQRIGAGSNFQSYFHLVLHQAVTDARVNVAYFVPMLTGNYDHPIYNRTVSYCSYLVRPTTDRVLHMIYDGLGRSGNLPKRCPIAPNAYFFNTSWDNIRLPSALPSTIFRLNLAFYSGPKMELVVGLRWYGVIKKTDS